FHIKGFEKLGASVRTEHGYVEAVTERLRGSDILFDKITVTGTENLMMAAVLADGRTILQNAACEPEVVDLADMLNDMGGKVRGAGTPTITIEGVSELKGTTHRIPPDRIAAGTLLAAGAITNGELMRMGGNIRSDGSRAIVTGKTQLSGATVIASDLRASASLVIAALVADGITVVDRVYHLDRGYEKIEEKLRSVGAQVERLK